MSERKSSSGEEAKQLGMTLKKRARDLGYQAELAECGQAAHLAFRGSSVYRNAFLPLLMHSTYIL